MGMRQPSSSFGKGPGGPWWATQRSKILFERGLGEAYPQTVRKSNSDGGMTYCLRLGVPDYESRRVELKVVGYAHVAGAAVTVDGSMESPHRYGDGSLCLWHPDDPAEMRWRPQDGIVRLIDLVVVHLFREAWWRETGDWPGPEAPHGTPKDV
jgi:hypothetical protein